MVPVAVRLWGTLVVVIDSGGGHGRGVSDWLLFVMVVVVMVVALVIDTNLGLARLCCCHSSIFVAWGNGVGGERVRRNEEGSRKGSH